MTMRPHIGKYIMKKTVYVLGNPIESLDRAAVSLIPKLKKFFPRINFIHFDPTEELPIGLVKNIIIIDTVIGIEKVMKFDDLNRWKLSPRVTVHDYDLPLSLGILKKLGKIKKVSIIGIPPKEKATKILGDLKKYLRPAEF